MRLQRPEDYFVKVLLEKIKVKDIMAVPVIAIPVDAPFYRVEEKFRIHGIRHLPVTNSKNVLVGLITQRELFRLSPPRLLMDGTLCYDREMLDTIILENVMTREPKTVRPEDSVGTALLLMVNGKYGCLPVVKEKQQLCGIMTQMDILKIAAQIYQEGQRSGPGKEKG